MTTQSGQASVQITWSELNDARDTMPLHDEPAWPGELKVTAPAAVEVLWHPAKRRHLAPFLGQSAGLAEAAQALGVKKTAMSYWIRRLLDVGLIRPSGIEQLTRHKVARYRCIADRLRISLADAPLASHEAVFDDTDTRWHPLARRALARSVARQAPWLDMVIEANGTTGLGVQMQPRGPGAPRDDFIYYWGRLWLTAAECDALRSSLDALWSQYGALSDKANKAQTMLMHLVAVPDNSR
jgi:transposase-like protein